MSLCSPLVIPRSIIAARTSFVTSQCRTLFLYYSAHDKTTLGGHAIKDFVPYRFPKTNSVKLELWGGKPEKPAKLIGAMRLDQALKDHGNQRDVTFESARNNGETPTKEPVKNDSEYPMTGPAESHGEDPTIEPFGSPGNIQPKEIAKDNLKKPAAKPILYLGPLDMVQSESSVRKMRKKMKKALAEFGIPEEDADEYAETNKENAPFFTASKKRAQKNNTGTSSLNDPKAKESGLPRYKFKTLRLPTTKKRKMSRWKRFHFTAGSANGEYFDICMAKMYLFLRMGMPVEVAIQGKGLEELEAMVKNNPHLHPAPILNAMPPGTCIHIDPQTDYKTKIAWVMAVPCSLRPRNITDKLYEYRERVLADLAESARLGKRPDVVDTDVAKRSRGDWNFTRGKERIHLGSNVVKKIRKKKLLKR